MLDAPCIFVKPVAPKVTLQAPNPRQGRHMEPNAQQPGTSLEPARAPSSAATDGPLISPAVATDSSVTPATFPAVLERSSFEYHLKECVDEFRPVGHVEFMVVRDIARHITAMETWNEGAGALQRQLAQRLPDLVVPEGDEGELEDVALAAAVSAPEVHLAEQHAQRRSRALYRALQALLALQARRNGREAAGQASTPQNQFLTETACEDYLRKRFEQGCHQCPRCGCRNGHYICTRRCWECAKCKRQVGLRTGTVAADSPLPLLAWFTAIRLLLSKPTIGTTELGIKLGISRSATVRKVARKVTAAMGEENASDLLAGLDLYYARCPSAPPESGAPSAENTGAGSEDIQGLPKSDASPADTTG